MIIKLSLDMTMTILMILAMLSQLTGDSIHETVGVILFILFFTHNILNHRWYLTMSRGKYTLHRILGIICDFLLATILIVVIITGVLISQTLFTFLSTVEGGATLRRIHQAAGFWAYILIGIHLGMHWIWVLNGVRKMLGLNNSKTRVIVLRILAVLSVVYGIKASFDENVAARLISYFTYSFVPFGVPPIQIIFDYVSILAIYVFVAHYALKWILKKNQIRRKNSKK